MSVSTANGALGTRTAGSATAGSAASAGIHARTGSTTSASTATNESEDFQHLDRSSSFQTSTDSPHRIERALRKQIQQQQPPPDISGLQFFNENITSVNNHASYIRKSIVISPSWREIKSSQADPDAVDDEAPTAELSFAFDNELPTSNIGMVASPSLQKLSEILTSKVSNSKVNVPTKLSEIIEAESDHETVYNSETGMKRNFSANTLAQTVASNETYQLSSNVRSPELQPDSVEVNTQPVSRFDPRHGSTAASFQYNPNALSKSSSVSSGGYNYTDIYEHYSPQRNPSVAEDHMEQPNRAAVNPNRMSVISEQFTLGNIKTPKFDDGFFENNDKLPEETEQSNELEEAQEEQAVQAADDSQDPVKEIGYDNDDTETSDFSFVPSMRQQNSNQQAPLAKSKEVSHLQAPGFVTSLDSPFLQNAGNRLSMRIVNESLEKIAHHYDFGLTPSLDVSSPLFKNDLDLQPNLKIQPTIQEYQQEQQLQQPQEVPQQPQQLPQQPQQLHQQQSQQHNQQQLSPLISQSENADPFYEAPKNVAEKQQVNTQQYSSLINSAHVATIKPESQPLKSPKLNQRSYQEKLQPATPQLKTIPKSEPVQKAEPKPKKGKLTFKSLFNKSTTPTEKSHTQSRPKSFTIGQIEESNKKKVPIAEKKEKSKSLLSSWKRKSIFSSSTPNLSEKVAEPTPKTPKTPNERRSRTMSFSSILTPRQLSPHKHTNSVPVIKSAQSSAQPTPLLRSYGFDQTPAMEAGTFDYKYIPHQQNYTANALPPPKIDQASPTFQQIPYLNTKSSMQQISNSTSENYEQAQSAVVYYESPLAVINDEAGDIDESMEKVVDLSVTNTTKISETTHSSSVYDDFAPANEQLPEPHMIHELKPITPPTVYIDQFDNDKTPVMKSPSTVGNQTPVSMTVASFTTSPNKFHIGDDLFPKNLNVNEIESIVTLERSRSMRSMKSSRSNRPPINSPSARSIVQIVQSQEDDFDEVVLPDGSVLVKSPSFPPRDIIGANSSRRSSILKSRLSSPLPDVEEFDQDLSDLIGMINFDSNDDAELLDTDFNFDFETNISPPRKAIASPTKSLSPQILASPSPPPRNFKKKIASPKRHSFEPPRKIGEHYKPSFNEYVEGDDDYFEHDDFELLEASETPIVSKIEFAQYDSPVEFIAANPRQVSRESVEQIIKVEEDIRSPQLEFTEQVPQPNYDAFIPTSQPNRISLSFKGLKGPSLNNSLKATTQDAIIDSISHINTGIIPSDSENSIFQTYNDDEQNNYTSEQYPQPPHQQTYEPDYQSKRMSLQPAPIFTPQYDSDQYVLESPFQTHSSYSYEDLPNKVQGSPIDKSKRFMAKLANNEFGHLSTVSLPAGLTTPTSSKPKKLNKRRAKSTASFGKLFGSKEDKPCVKFSSRILLYETYGEDEYDREPDSATCNNLTPQIAIEIKAELNALKASMPIHESSMCYTHFF